MRSKKQNKSENIVDFRLQMKNMVISDKEAAIEELKAMYWALEGTTLEKKLTKLEKELDKREEEKEDLIDKIAEFDEELKETERKLNNIEMNSR